MPQVNPPNPPRIAARDPEHPRAWIIEAFNRLVLRRPYHAMRVTDVARRAGVGRSTFYEHFRDKEAVLHDAIAPVLSPLAGAVAPSASVQAIEGVLLHFAENRSAALAMLHGDSIREIERALIALVRARMPETQDATAELLSPQIAYAQLALVRAWLESATVPTGAQDVAAALIRTTRALMQAHPAQHDT